MSYGVLDSEQMDKGASSSVRVLTIAQYEAEVKLMDLLGEGAYGQVFKAKWQGQDVAVKMMMESNHVVEMEYTLRSVLKDECFLQYLDLFKVDTKYVLIMEYLEGTNLFNFLFTPYKKPRSGLNISSEVRWNFCRTLAETVNRFHQLGFSHSDIKPENIMVIKNGTKVKLVDYGFVCKSAPTVEPKEARVCDPRRFLGTPLYLAPDLWDRTRDISFDQRCKGDVWSLGLTFYLMWCPVFLVELRSRLTPKAVDLSASRCDLNLLEGLLGQMLQEDWRLRCDMKVVLEMLTKSKAPPKQQSISETSTSKVNKLFTAKLLSFGVLTSPIDVIESTFPVLLIGTVPHAVFALSEEQIQLYFARFDILSSIVVQPRPIDMVMNLRKLPEGLEEVNYIESNIWTPGLSFENQVYSGIYFNYIPLLSERSKENAICVTRLNDLMRMTTGYLIYQTDLFKTHDLIPKAIFENEICQKMDKNFLDVWWGYSSLDYNLHFGWLVLKNKVLEGTPLI